MIKEVVVCFNGLVTLILGVAIANSGLKGMFVGYERWLVGFGCIFLAVLCIYYSGLFQAAFTKKVVKTIENKKQEV